MKKWVFCLVVGLAMLSVSTGVGINDDKEVRCGSEIMMPGEVCEETRGGTTVDTETYEEIKDRQESARRTFNTWGRWALLGGGIVLTAAGVLGIVTARKRRRAMQGTAQDATPAAGQRPAGYPSPGGHQPPGGYLPAAGHAQSASYPPAGHGQPAGYAQPVGHAQPVGRGQPATYPQPAGYAQPASYPPAGPQPPAGHQPSPAGYPSSAGYQQPDFGPQPSDFGPQPGS